MIPIRSTYRLQFRNGMDFDGACRLVPYLDALGISHLYASPVMTAVDGSTHGYDITQANEIDPCLGGLDGLRRLSGDLHARGMGLILDIVPNHMAAHLENPWWRSVVTWGLESPFARYFDIDWSERLTLPFLGGDFDAERASGTMRLALDPRDGLPALRYHDTFYPLHPRSYPQVLGDAEEPTLAALCAAGASFDPADEAGTLCRLAGMLSAPDAVEAIAEGLAAISRDAARLRAAHDAQPWRLTDWKTAGRHLTYRRFFEIAGLAGMRMEDAGVFEDSHRLIIDLVREGIVDGLRIDHIDGLAHPRGYLGLLRAAIGPDPCIVVEKILERSETFPADWPVQGTTGYEFIGALADVLVDEGGRKRLQQAFDGLKPPHRQCSHAEERRSAKRQMLTENFAGEVAGVARVARTLADAGGLPFDGDVVAEAIRAFVIALPVYRTYTTASVVPEGDRALARAVCRDAIEQASDGVRSAVDFVAALLVDDPVPSEADLRAEFRRRFQQLSGPIMAKAVEDTLFYRENAVIALNEVGGDPGAPVGGVPAFDAFMAYRAETMPGGLSASATHDTKRGEDARARLYTLTEAPEAWIAATGRWRALNASLRTMFDGRTVPEPEVEWLLYQSFAGVWTPGAADDPAALRRLGERMGLYATKALREAKRATRWTEPDLEYERLVGDFIEGAMRHEAFLRDFDATLAPFVDAGRMNALSQTMIKLTAPGIPDVYQGSERCDFSLVDPDNRAVPDIAGMTIPARPEPTGANFPLYKQWLMATVLRERRKTPLPFSGPYRPLAVSGGGALAFLRSTQQAFAIVAVPRLTFGKVEPDTLLLRETALRGGAIALPSPLAGRLVRSVLTGDPFVLGRDLPLSALFAEAPAALLVSMDR
ncbi:malto-oligosyltrehalose synthase [Shinella sp. S4-D37]|uniref:malto-oligosyltrehalose synthase n=1 Tax=Shinella sp. S4-D37 TaxID=3161999 RepID=UPI0034672718